MALLFLAPLPVDFMRLLFDGIKASLNDSASYTGLERPATNGKEA